uniref:Bromo domain-containing protein n=1 Tax=Oncorhynchus tshawytscha TaxID=74940 RepID=A0A8C8G938_ONCTS
MSSDRGDSQRRLANHLATAVVACIGVGVEGDLSYELQQAYRIFHGFLLEKHKGITTPFLHPIGFKDHTDGAEGQLKQSMCFRRMEEKFVSREYETITEFVADFRLMLENCYRHHGVDHWISKQAQKLEIMLEQKLTLLSRTLREKTTLAVTSKGRFGTEDERGPVGTSTRRRSVPRSLATITVGGNESIMIQALRLEEQQKAKEEKRQRELEKKESEENSAKEVEEWERSLLSQVAQNPVKTLWELPAIGHFLCLAQAALNLPEIVFFELERCLLMPRCSVFLSKIMSSLLCQPQRRGMLHRRPALTYRRWESELRQRVQGWYYAMGTAEDQGWMAEQLGLSHQFFRTTGEVSPLEENPFHLLPFIQRVWLLKGLCDNVYETQKDVQDAVLGQPIHECRESILGYDGNENAYIHFPHFCGADLRIYCQSASMPPDFPFPAVWVRRVEPDEGISEDSDEQKDSEHLVSMETEDYEEKPGSDRMSGGRIKGENGGTKSCETRLSVGEHSYTGKFPALPGEIAGRPSVAVPMRQTDVKVDGDKLTEGLRPCPRCVSRMGAKSEDNHRCRCAKNKASTTSASGAGHTRKMNLTEDNMDRIRAKKKKREKKREVRAAGGQRRPDRTRLCKAKAAKSTLQRAATNIKKKDKRKKRKMGGIRTTVVNAFKHWVCLVLTSCVLMVLQERWYFRREAVKDLHITLIRLLNELSPWEPKLVKAFHRNRLRLKKDYDDFKKHPDCDNFVREEWVAEDLNVKYALKPHNKNCQGILELIRCTFLLLLFFAEDSVQLRAEALRGSFTVVTRQEMLTLNEHRPSTRGLKRLHSGIDEDPSPIKRGRIGSNELTTSPEGSEMENRPRETNPVAQRAGETSQVVVTPMAGFQRAYKPVQLHTLLAKSVGNKVTLIHHHSRYLPRPTTPTSKHSQTVHTTPIPKSPIQVVYKMPEGMGLVRKDGSPVKIEVQPILDQKTGNKIMQRVVILPSNMLIQKSEDKSLPQQLRTLQVPAFKDSTPLSQSSGFTMPQRHDNRILTPSTTISPRLQTSLTPGYKVVQLPGCKASSTTQNVIPNRFNPISAASTDPSKPPDRKQELKTVCIRDSQSILVTTRGGNTGVVKVQSSDQSRPGSIPASPVITISPQFKAFLVSKTFPPAATTVPVVTSTPVAQSRSGPSLLRSSTVTSSTTTRQSPITAVIPMATSQTASSDVNVAVNQGCTVSSTLAVNAQLLKSIVTVPGKPAGATQTSLVQCVNKPVLKRVGPDEKGRSPPFTKFILVSPSSNITSAPATKVTSTTAPSALPGQSFMFISQSPSTGNPKPASSVSGPTTQSPTMSIPTEAMKIGLNLGQAIGSANFRALNKVQSINLLPGCQIRLPQQANLCRPVSALAQSTLKKTFVSASKSGLLAPPSSHIVTSTAQMPSSTLLTGSQLHGIPSSSVIPNRIKVAGQPGSSIIRGLISSNTPVSVTTPLSPVKTSLLTSPAQVSQSQNSVGVATPAQMLSTPQSPPAPISTQQSSPVQPAGNTNPVSSTITTLQQKIVINTTATLAGGTQILLNNTRFVVPPQGLGPGQHVLIISSPAVPVAAPSPRGAIPATGVPQGPMLPGLALPAQSPRMARSPGTHQPQQAALRSPTLAAPSTVKVGPSIPVSFTVPRQMVAVQASLSPTSTTTNSSPQVSHWLHAPATIHTHVVAAPHLTQPEGMGGFSLSSLPGSPSAAQMAGVAQSPSKQLPLHTALGVNTPLKAQQLMSFMQPMGVVSRSRTQVLPAVVVPPIGSTVSRMQTLPVATIPSIGSAFSSKQASPVATVSPSNCTIIMTPAQPIRTVMSAETIRMPTVLSNPQQQQILGLGKPPLQSLQAPASAVQTTSPTTKQLVSPDGAVLNLARGPTTITGLPEMANKSLAALVVTPNSTGRVPLPSANTANLLMPTQAE